jgi:hypothetical protein
VKYNAGHTPYMIRHTRGRCVIVASIDNARAIDDSQHNDPHVSCKVAFRQHLKFTPHRIVCDVSSPHITVTRHKPPILTHLTASTMSPSHRRCLTMLTCRTPVCTNPPPPPPTSTAQSHNITFRAFAGTASAAATQRSRRRRLSG